MSIADMLANQRQWHIEETDVRAGLRSMPDESVHCVVTSPPYWGLRAYGTDAQVWGQRDKAGLAQYGCIPMSTEHVWGDAIPGDRRGGSGTFNGRNGHGEKYARSDPKGSVCIRCGAWRGELGSEPTIALFVEHLVEVFRQVRRVLRADGTCWLNIGDSYASSWAIGRRSVLGQGSRDGLKEKDLCLIPERLAIALQDDGWWVRSRIAWCKTSAMPESVRDRPTSAWEHVWLLTKSARYYYDGDAVRMPQKTADEQHEGKSGYRDGHPNRQHIPSGWDSGPGAHDVVPKGRYEREYGYDHRELNPLGANLRNYWVLGPSPFSEAHFATFPPELARRCVLAGSRVGNLVLDPFAGSGTVAMVSLRHGRRAIGFDLNPEYVQMARRRIEQDAPLFNTVPS